MPKALKLSNNKIYIGCIPVWAHLQHPPDQSRCVMQQCNHCQKDMWVSEKKRKMFSKNPDKYEIYCLYCLATSCQKNGDEIEIVNINEIQ